MGAKFTWVRICRSGWPGRSPDGVSRDACESGLYRGNAAGQAAYDCALGSWARDTGLAVADLTRRASARFWQARRVGAASTAIQPSALLQFLEHLRVAGVAPPCRCSEEPSSTEHFIRGYLDHLHSDRGLCARSIEVYSPFVRAFIAVGRGFRSTCRPRRIGHPRLPARQHPESLGLVREAPDGGAALVSAFPIPRRPDGGGSFDCRATRSSVAVRRRTAAAHARRG